MIIFTSMCYRTMAFEINKQERETNQSLIRRFTKRLRDSGILVGVKRASFHTKEKSKQVQRKTALRRLEKQREYQRALKLGQQKQHDSRR